MPGHDAGHVLKVHELETLFLEKVKPTVLDIDFPVIPFARVVWSTSYVVSTRKHVLSQMRINSNSRALLQEFAHPDSYETLFACPLRRNFGQPRMSRLYA